MPVLLKQIQSFVDHCHEAGAEEITVEHRGLKVTVKYREGLSPSGWAELAGQVHAREIIEAGTDPSRSEEEKRAAERLIFASSS